MTVPDGWAVHSCVCGANEIIAGPGVTVAMRCPTCPPDDELLARRIALRPCEELAEIAKKHAEEQRQ